MEDKVKKYQEIIQHFLATQASYRPNKDGVETQVIADTLNHHYQLLRIGWRKGRFVRGCRFHFDIKNDKVWIQENRTDIDVAEELREMGIPKSDIVIGFLPIEGRELSGYAVA